MKSITDILFKQQLEAPTSFEEVVVESSEMITSKKKKKIFKYLLGDSAKKSIYLCPFTKLDLKNTSLYLFTDVLIGSFNQTRVLKYELVTFLC